MLNAAFFNRLPENKACRDYKGWIANKLYIVAQIFLSAEKTRKKQFAEVPCVNNSQF